MKRPQQRPRVRRQETIELPHAQRREAAERATYIGSPEHKQPNPRSDASLCPPELAASRQELTGWLRLAIESGAVGGCLESGFPRYVWHREGLQWFEARLTNQMLGQYKGYPVDAEQVPPVLGRRSG